MSFYPRRMRQIVLVLLVVCACKREQPARHVALPPGPAAVLDPSPNPTFPASAPDLEARDVGGLAGQVLWDISIWSDGTIRFAGDHCRSVRRAMLPPSRVHELGAALGQLGEVSPMADEDVCSDDFIVAVHANSRWLERGECARTHDPTLDNALELIRTAIGTMPCDQTVLVFKR